MNTNSRVDWWLIGAIFPILAAGLSTMYSFTGNNSYAEHQIVWISLALIVFFILIFVDFRFVRSRWVSVALFTISILLLLSLFFFGKASHGAENWLSFGYFSIQPADIAKLSLIIILAKYFSRRHIEIGNIRHILVSGIYASIFFLIVLVLPDLGSAIIIFLIWLCMIMVSGVSKKHLFMLLSVGAICFILLWNFGFKEYQKNRIRTFVDPYADIHRTGYNAYQSRIAIGSGGLVGKGFGYGTQSRLKFLPEYQTDFIFAAYAEEWGLAGVFILFSLYGIVVWRILVNAIKGDTNFEILYGIGVALYFIVHISINVGMNMQLLPVTGTPLPFMSYGGTHIISEFVLLGILVSMRKYARPAHKGSIKNEFLLSNINS